MPLFSGDISSKMGAPAARLKPDMPHPAAAARKLLREKRFTLESAGNSLSFHDPDVPVDRQFCERVDFFAGPRPTDFQLIDRCGVANSQNLAWIMRGKVTPAGVLRTGPLLAPGLPCDLGPDGVTVARHALQRQSEPIVALGGIVL